MPDRDNWTAAMVLRWVLTRDQAAVLAMVDTYIGVFEDHTVSRLAREDIDAVTIAYCIDPTIPPGEIKDATAVVRSQWVIAAKDEIYRALRRGDLEARARRNGTGDIEKITPEQWLSLKFQSWNGHDPAVPTDIDQDVLDLRRPIEDYLRGRVPADVRPAVWPDPLFSAGQVMQIWRRDVPNEAAPSAEPVGQLVEYADKPVPGNARNRSERPDGVSDTDWQTYLSALEKGHDLDVRGNITKAARSIADDRGHARDFESERRALHRVLKKKRAVLD
jgi:hypothetical protein